MCVQCFHDPANAQRRERRARDGRTCAELMTATRERRENIRAAGYTVIVVVR